MIACPVLSMKPGLIYHTGLTIHTLFVDLTDNMHGHFMNCVVMSNISAYIICRTIK